MKLIMKQEFKIISQIIQNNKRVLDIGNDAIREFDEHLESFNISIR